MQTFFTLTEELESTPPIELCSSLVHRVTPCCTDPLASRIVGLAIDGIAGRCTSTSPLIQPVLSTVKKCEGAQ